MRAAITFISLSATLLLTAQSLSAQVRLKIPEPKIHLECTVDEQGLKQWKAVDEKCPLCKGMKVCTCDFCKDAKKLETCPICQNKKKITCRLCTGTGKMFDQLSELICPYCQGLAWYPCGMCGGRGSFPVQGGGNKEQKCGSCKAKGAFKCTVCKGKQHIPVAKVGRKGPGQASVAELLKARKVLEQAHERLEALKINSNESKTSKALFRTVGKASKVIKALKDMQGLLTTSLKGLRKGTAYVAYNEWVLKQFAWFKDQSIYLLRHQILLINICLERAEHNEKILADKDK